MMSSWPSGEKWHSLREVPSQSGSDIPIGTRGLPKEGLYWGVKGTF